MNDVTTSTIEETTNMAEAIVSNTIEETKHMTSIFSELQEKFFGFFPTLINAILFLIIGMICTKTILKVIYNLLDRAKIEETATGFLKSAVRIVLYILMAVIVLSILNVPMTSIVTIIGTMGVTIGLALKDSLSNVSGGFIILFNRPFKVGDYIETVGISGTVEQIGIFYTTVVTSDNKTAHVPNGSITNSNIINYNQKELRRLDLEYTISYSADFKLAQKLINNIIMSNDKVLKDKDITVRMGRQDSSSIVIFVKVWTHSDNYFNLGYDLNESIKSKFDEYNIEIPFNQLDIHLKGEEDGEKIAKIK